MSELRAGDVRGSCHRGSRCLGPETAGVVGSRTSLIHRGRRDF